MIFQEETKMNVKKLITLLLAVMMVLAMAACGAKTEAPAENTPRPVGKGIYGRQ